MKRTKLRKNISLRILLLMITVVSNFTLTLANPIKSLSSENGLSNRYLYNITKDHKGYLWIATRSGIDKFNGEGVANYTISFNNLYENERIKGVTCNHEDLILAYSNKSLHVYEEAVDSFARLPELPFIKQKQNKISISTIYIDSNNITWVGTTGGLYYSNDLKSWKSIPLLDQSAIHSITEGYDNDIWVGTTKGLFLIKRNDNNFYCKKESSSSTINDERIQSLFYDKQSKSLWIGTFYKGVYKLKTDGSGNAVISHVYPTTYPIRSIVKISDSRIWIGTDGNGIFEFDQFSDKLLKSYSNNGSKDYTLDSNSIYQLLPDESRVWILTYSSGIRVFNVKSICSQTYTFDKENSNSLINDNVNSLLEDNSGNIWFGTNCGISRYNPASKSWSRFLHTQNAGHNDCSIILAFCESKNHIWAGGYATDLVCINKQNGSVEKIKINVDNLSEDKKQFIYAIEKDENENIWFGGNLGNLTKYNPETKQLTRYKIAGISKIINYDKDRLLIGTVKGLIIMNKTTGSVTNINLKSANKESGHRSFIFIKNIFNDPNHPDLIWIGTDGEGLFRYNLKSKECINFTTYEGLSSNIVYDIQKDSFNRMWISTENGLNCYTPATQKFEIFTENDGLISNILNNNAFIKLSDGKFLLGTPAGAMEIIPEEINKKEKKKFNLRFTCFNILYEKVLADTPNSPLTKGIDDTDYIKLDYSQRSFSFDFINLDIKSNSKTLYSWKLENFDKNWSVPSEDHKAIYTNIPSGKYRFMVKAIDPNKKEESEVRIITLKVKAPFWATLPAFLIYALCIGIIIYFVLRFWNERMERRSSNEKIKFFINMAHDIRTPITLIKAPLNELELENLSDDGRFSLGVARKNLDKLFNIVTQLLDFQRLEKNSMNLIIEETDYNQYLNNIMSSFIILAKEKSINLQIIVDQQIDKVWIDRSKIALVMENLISNSIKYTNKNGNIRVQSRLTDKHLIIEVVDDGIGIPAKAHEKIFSQFYRAQNAINSKETGSGIGLMLTQKLINLHKGKLSFTSSENIGTSFIIEIPYRKTDYSVVEIANNHHQEPTLEQAKNENERNKIKILLVEDNDELRQYLTKYLGNDYSVTETTNGKEALEYLKSETTDMIISDIMMPEVDGYELCLQVKKNIETCHIPILLLTSMADRGDIIKGFNLGADYYITKPFDLSILESKIKSILKNRALFKKKFIRNAIQEEDNEHICDLDRDFIKQIFAFIEQNMENENFTIDDLAVEMAISRSVLYKKIKALTGKNPKDFIKEVKMRRAADLLIEQKYSINEVAYLTGFPNSKYFSTAFKKYYGVSPSKFLEEDQRIIYLQEDESEQSDYPNHAD